MIDHILRDAFGVLSCPFWSTVLQYAWCSAVDTHLKLLDRAVSGARFLTGGELSVTLLILDLLQFCVCCIRSGVTPDGPLNDALPGLYMPVRVTRGAMVAHRYTYAPPRCRTSQYRRTFFPSQCHSGTILLTPCSMVWDWQVSRAEPMLFYWPNLLYSYYTIFPYLFFLSIGWYCGVGVFGLIGCISLSLSIALPTSFNNNKNNNHQSEAYL